MGTLAYRLHDIMKSMIAVLHSNRFPLPVGDVRVLQAHKLVHANVLVTTDTPEVAYNTGNKGPLPIVVSQKSNSTWMKVEYIMLQAM